MVRTVLPLKPSRRSTFRPLAIVAGVGVVALVALAARWAFSTADQTHAPVPGPAQLAPPRPPEPPPLAPLAPEDVAHAKTNAKGHMQLAQGQRQVELTLDPKVQADITRLLDETRVPYGAVVLIDPRTGRVQVAAEHREAGDPVATMGAMGIAGEVPAASVFKVVTAAALLEAGQQPDSSVCFHGGRQGIVEDNLRDSPQDHQCQTLTEALANSSNAAFAKFGVQSLKPGDLEAMAKRLGFGAVIDTDLEAEASACSEGASEVERGRCAAGFAGSTLSPLHGAYLAATVANRGVAMRPTFVLDDSAAPPQGQQLLSAEVADKLKGMMAQTVVAGTGRHAFGRRPAVLRDITVAGKTGSLSGKDPSLYRHFSWFIGFAPVENPQIAIAVLAVNGEKWRVKAAGLARDSLAAWFAAQDASAGR